MKPFSLLPNPPSLSGIITFFLSFFADTKPKPPIPPISPTQPAGEILFPRNRMFCAVNYENPTEGFFFFNRRLCHKLMCFFPLVCQSRVDLGFLIDGSGSMRRTFIQIIDFVKTLISFFPISQSQTRIGLIVFSSKAYPVFPFNRYNSKASVIRAVDRVRFPYGGTRTGNALRFTSGYVFCDDDKTSR